MKCQDLYETCFREPQTISVDNVDDWLNESFFRNVIKNHLKLDSDDYIIVSINTKPASKAGDNYMSVMLRSNIEIELTDGTRRTQIYIVKALFFNVFNENLVNEYAAFPREQKMYSKFLPEFEKLYADVGVDVSFGPKVTC